MHSKTDLFPESETLTISLSDVHQIPWATADTYTFELETFAAAVFGSLISVHDSNIKNKNDKGVLLEKYFCDGAICQAQLKQGIYFHNGREVNAYDVEFSLIKELLNHNNNTFVYSMLSGIEGVQEFYEQKKQTIVLKNFSNINYPSGLISGIEVIDKYNIILKLKHKNYYIFQTLSTGYIPIYPIEELIADYSAWKKYPVGFGRYKIIHADVEKFEFMLQKVNEDDPITKYVRIVFGSHSHADIRLATQNIPFDTTSEKLYVMSSVYGNGGFLFNFKTKLGSNINFRKAINVALDRNKICNTAFYNEISPEDQMLPNFGRQKIYRLNDSVVSQDKELAKEYLKKVPDELWKNKVLHVYSFWTFNSNLEETSYFKEMQAQLFEVGIRVEFHNTQMNYTRFHENDENVLWWTGFDNQTEEPNSNFSYFQKGSFFNNIYPEDPKFFNLYNESIHDLHKGKNSIYNLNQYFREQNIMVIVFNIHNAFVYKKKRIKNFGEQNSSVKINLTEIKLN